MQFDNDLGQNPNSWLDQGTDGFGRPRPRIPGIDTRPPIMRMRRKDLEVEALKRGFHVTTETADQLRALINSGYSPAAQQRPALQTWSGRAAPDDVKPAKPPATKVDALDEAAARESVRSEIMAMRFLALKALAKRYGLDCPAGTKGAKREALVDQLVAKIEAE